MSLDYRPALLHLSDRMLYQGEAPLSALGLDMARLVLERCSIPVAFPYGVDPPYSRVGKLGSGFQW